MKEAERLYKKKYPNKDFSALADSTRKKYYYEAMREYERRTGKPAYTQVSGGVSFREYFEKQMTAQQQRDWLGPQRYKLYKDFKLPLDRFIPPYPNKRMTIIELKEQDKASFVDVSKKPVPKPQLTKEELHQKHLSKREKQRLDAYDKRRDNWVEEMKKAGVDDTVAHQLADLYTPEIAKLGKPPKIILTDAPDAYYSHYWGTGNRHKGGEIVLRKDPSTWEGHPITAIHEFGHWVDNHTRFRKIRYNTSWADYEKAGSDFANAVKADWNILKSKQKGFLEYYNEYEYFDISKNRMEGGYWREIREKLFGNKKTLDLGEEKILRQYQDVVGSATKGKYGGGHKKSYYKKEIGNKEAFAQTFSAYIRKDEVFKLEFPNQWNYIDNLMKGLHK